MKTGINTTPRKMVTVALSPGEEGFAFYCKLEGLMPTREHMFHPARKWRFDFAFQEAKLGIEIEGGTWTAGRHNRGTGYEKDCRKYNAAVLLGWRVLRFTPSMVACGDAIKDVLEALL